MGKTHYGNPGIKLVSPRTGHPALRPIFPGTDDDTVNALFPPHYLQWTYPTTADLYVDDANGNDSWNGTAPAFVSGSTGPKKTIGAAVTAAVSGNEIAVRAGWYRLTSTVTANSSKQIKIHPYGNELAIVDGAAIVTGWTTVAGAGAGGITVYWAPFTSAMRPHTSTNMTSASGSNNANFPTNADSKYAMMVSYGGGNWKTGKGAINQLVAGTFFHDYTNGRLYVADNPAGQTVEAQVIRRAFDFQANGSSIQGFVFQRAGGEYADTGGSDGAVRMSGNNSVFKNNTIAFTPSFGLLIGGAGTTFEDVSDNWFYHCGTLAICGIGGATQVLSGTTLKRNVFWKVNKIFGHRIDWATGAVKLLSGTDMYMFDNYVYDSNGAGLWYDYSVYRSSIIGNFCEKIAFAAYDSEMSRLITIASNVAFNAYYGILCQGSHDDIYAHNTLIDNYHFIRIINDNRTITGDVDGITGNTGTLRSYGHVMACTGRQVGVAAAMPLAFISTDDFDDATSATTWFSNTPARLDATTYVRPSWQTFASSNKEIYWETGSAGSPTQYTKVSDFNVATGFEANHTPIAKSAMAIFRDIDGRRFQPFPGAIGVGPTIDQSVRDLIGPIAGTGTATRGAIRYPGRSVFSQNTHNGYWDRFNRANNATTPGTSDSGHAWTESNGNGGVINNEFYFPDDVNQNQISMAAAGTGFSDGIWQHVASGNIANGTNFRVDQLVFNRIDTQNQLEFYSLNGTARFAKLDANVRSTVNTWSVTTSDDTYDHYRVEKWQNWLRFSINDVVLGVVELTGVLAKYNVSGGGGERLAKGGTPTANSRTGSTSGYALLPT